MVRRSKRRSYFRRYTPTEKEIKDFYTSKEWADIRYSALDRSDGRCVLCGRSASIHGVTMHVDHVKPVRKYWHLRFDTRLLQVLCGFCNWGKGNRTRDWRHKKSE